MAKLSIRDWPDDVHTRLKLEAVRRGVGLREILLEAVRWWWDVKHSRQPKFGQRLLTTRAKLKEGKPKK